MTESDSTLVSVVLPTYHRAPVLGGAIESVLGQTYDNFELVIVDDGSDDATPELVSSFDDSRVRYRRRGERVCVSPAQNGSVSTTQTGGVSGARNEGVRRADGDAVAFIDSDDRWHPDKLRQQVDALRNPPAGVGSDCGVVYTPITKSEGEPRTRDGVSGDVYEAVRRLDVPTYTSTLLIRRAAFEQAGGFDERLDCFEDWDLCLRLARDWEFAYIDAPMVRKGTGGDNVSADPDRLARAVERLFDVHDLPAEARAQFLADAGKTYCEAGRIADGRSYLRRALELDFRTNAAAAFALSLPGSPRVFDAGMGAVYAAEQRFARRG